MFLEGHIETTSFHIIFSFHVTAGFDTWRWGATLDQLIVHKVDKFFKAYNQ